MSVERVTAILRSLETIRPSKHDTQRRLLAQRAEIARALPRSVVAQEQRAIELMKRPDWGNVMPTLVLASKPDYALWHYLRVCVSGAPWSGRPGRCLRYFCLDRNSGGILGVIDYGSEVQALGPRDRWIGWTREQKLKGGGLQRVINLGTCVPTQPFGWLCGGKFIAEASSTADIAGVWERKYHDAPAIVSTTSLYGKSSQYNRLPHWPYLGCTTGSSPHMYLSVADRRVLAKFVADAGVTTRSASVASFGAVTSAADVLAAAKRLANYRGTFALGQPRGVYGSELYDGARGDLLTGKTRAKPARTVTEVADWFVERWYRMRLEKKREEVEAFDWNVYRLSRVIRAGSIESDATVDPDGEGPIDTAPALH